jgi:thiamine biosynthesis lipoprotein
MRCVSLILLMSTACAAEAEMPVLRGATMGTTYHIKFAPATQAVDHGKLQVDVENVLAEIDRQMSTYRPDSELSRFNRAPAGEWFAVSAATVEVVAAAQAISKKTDGALDVTVGPLVRLWHFGPADAETRHSKHELTPPAEELLRDARKHVGYQKLTARIDPPALRKECDGLEVDLSSIAPGYAIDRLAELLARRGLNDFMVEIGGEVRAAGRRADGKPWRVAIERPTNGERAMQSAVPLLDAAIATAGDYRKFFEHAGRRYSHIIDPATGRPVTHSAASVTVLADTCMEADGWDTPLLVLGPERGFECAEKHGISALFLLREETRVAVRNTTAWRKQFDP